jgi:hypothetical protein
MPTGVEFTGDTEGSSNFFHRAKKADIIVTTVKLAGTTHRTPADTWVSSSRRNGTRLLADPAPTPDSPLDLACFSSMK